MTPPKRKSPKSKKKAQEPGILFRLFSAAGRAAGRHPRLLLGVSTFAVTFGFIAANALWYQPGNHPSPLLTTRDPQDPNGIAGYRPVRRTEPEAVTTFRISREGEPDAGTPSEPVAVPAAEEVAAVPADQQPDLQPRELVAEVQRQLARRGLYQGVTDGLVGPNTTAAILFFQETENLPQTGEATPGLLAVLREAPAVETASVSPLPIEAVAVPAARPAEDVSAVVEDPVAAAIRSAERSRKPDDRQAPSPSRDLGPDIAASATLVLQIQRGLANIAYSDITVDGVAGAQTKAAIRRFEKHYRLPETGEPNEMVLKKLKSIGAL